MRGLPGFLLVSAMLAAARTASAQPVPAEESPHPPPYPYATILQVPANGCIWANQVYSNGAVIGGAATRSYFRCVQGSWKSFPSAAEAVDDARAGAAASGR